MQFFELTTRQRQAQSMAEYMTQLTYRIEDNKLAIDLMRVAEKLSDLDALFGKRYERDFDKDEKILVNSVKIMMKRDNCFIEA
jgi:DUF2075 family protein